MKKLFSLAMILFILLAFASCGRVPTEEITTSSEAFTFVNPLKGNTDEVTEAVNTEESEDETAENTSAASKEGNMDVITHSYYKYGENYASISSVNINSGDITVNLYGTLEVKVIRIGSRSSDMLIGYKAYDASGELIRDTYVIADLKGAFPGKTIKDVVFDVPYDTAKLEFFDYTGEQTEF